MLSRGTLLGSRECCLRLEICCSAWRWTGLHTELIYSPRKVTTVQVTAGEASVYCSVSLMWLTCRHHFKEKKYKSDLPLHLETSNNSASLRGDAFSLVTDQKHVHFSRRTLCSCQLPSLTQHSPSEPLDCRMNCQALNLSTARIYCVRPSADRNLNCTLR